MCVVDQFISDDVVLYNGDSVEVLADLPSESVHYVIYSPPFASLYTYSNSERDLGNCRSRNEFFEHYAFIVPELYRVLKPGRNLSFHAMQLPTSKEKDGYIGIHDFRGRLIAAHEKCLNCGKPRMSEMDDSHGCSNYEGLIFHSEVPIWKDPVTAMQRTKAIGLLHKQVVKDSCMSRQGLLDYFVTMRKPGVNAEPVAGEFDRYIGAAGTGPTPIGGTCQTCDGKKVLYDEYQESFPCPVCTGALKQATRFSIEVWQRYASPVWMDIDPSRTLQKGSTREHRDERHICPLQLDVIERGIELWSNPGNVVLSPFAGIGSEIYVAVRTGRRGIGIELKESYYKQACANVRSAELERNQVGLFTDLQRCDEEIAEAEQLLRDGHTDVTGLVRGLTDWRTERGLLLADSTEQLETIAALSDQHGKEAAGRTNKKTDS